MVSRGQVTEWCERPFDAGTAGAHEAAGRSRLLARLLAQRGIGVDKVERFFSPVVADLAKPEELPGVVEAADVILDAVAARREIVVFGDYDCDGVSATAILVRTLRAFGASAAPFLPHRLDEGYGMTDAAVGRMLGEHPAVALVVTVDNGINSIAQVDGLKRRGIAVVVTDHHQPSADGALPAADALVNPKVAAPKHLEGLCGAAVAYFLAYRLACQARVRGLYHGGRIASPLLVLAGLATVTDVMPLGEQNRIFVSEALRRFPKSAPLGLRELQKNAARTTAVRMTTHDFGFLIGPRINAAGRVASGQEALELVLCDDCERVRELAMNVDGYNRRRKELEQAMLEQAMRQVRPGAAVQVIDLPDGHPGVAGIVAARILEQLGGVPVFVQASGRGSARSSEGMSVLAVMEACRDTLEKFGGHEAAGGFSIKPGRIEEFRTQAEAFCRARYGEGASAAVRERKLLDAWVRPSELALETVDEILRMEPFGAGNPEPLFGIRGACLADVQPFGDGGQHLKLRLKGSGAEVVWWRQGARAEELRARASSAFDLVFRVTVKSYGGRHVELCVVDLA